MKKTLLDLYISASEAANNKFAIQGVMAQATAKVDSFKDAQVAEEDSEIWAKFYDEQVHRFVKLSEVLAPSAAKAKAQADKQ